MFRRSSWQQISLGCLMVSMVFLVWALHRLLVEHGPVEAGTWIMLILMTLASTLLVVVAYRVE